MSLDVFVAGPVEFKPELVHILLPRRTCTIDLPTLTSLPKGTYG